MLNFAKNFIVVISLLSIMSCSAAYHQENLHSNKEREMTVGIVQKEIRKGMSQADVAMALGSPNIVTKDSTGKETWIYDKIASEASYSNSSSEVGGGVGGGGIVGNALLIGLLSGGHSQSAGATSSTQKTLTVIIKFDGNKAVDDFSYHSTKF